MSIITKNTKVELVGRGILTLRPADHVMTGGEGSVYRVADTVIKLYTDENKMEREGMTEKIRLLSVLKNERIIAPQGLVLIGAKPAGFYMPAAEGEALPLFFTNDYRREKKLADKDASVLAERMRETAMYAHSKGAVMGDANEMNWFAIPNAPGGPEPRVIDVDSWAIGKWPVRAIMPSIRDWKTGGFTQVSDWFSWGVVTFQVYTGIHPYKGMLDGYTMKDMEKRMKTNVSVFAPGVKFNNAVRDFSCIPGTLLDWYHAEFQDGERSVPPSPFDTAKPAGTAAHILRAVTTTGSGMLVYEKVFEEIGNHTVKIFPCGVALLSDGKLVDLGTKRAIGTSRTLDCELVKVEGGFLKAETGPKGISYSFIAASGKETELSVNFSGKRVIRSADRLFLSSERGLTELSFVALGKPILCAGQTWDVMASSMKWFDGFGVEDTMGATHLVLPFGEKACTHLRVPELDGLRPVNGKAGNRFVSVVVLDKSGTYRKFELTIDREYRTYSLWQGISDGPELNLAVLPKGVCATIVQDGELNIFVPSSGAHNKVQDKHISTDMSLTNLGDRVVYIQSGAVWSLRMK